MIWQRVRPAACIVSLSLLVAACGTVLQSPSAPAAGQAASPAPAQPAAMPKPDTPQGVFDQVMALPAAQRDQALQDGARTEKTVVLYHVLAADAMEEVVKRFQQKYPFINVENVRLGSQAAIERILTEHRAGQQIFDVAFLSSPEMYVVRSQGLLGRYRSLEREQLHELFKDAEGYSTSFIVDPQVVGFNTRSVKPEEAPRTLEALLDPRWEGKLGRTTLGSRWIAGLEKYMGADKAGPYLEAVAKQDVRLYPSNSGLATALSRGEITVAFDLLLGSLLSEKKKGAPVDFVTPEPLFMLNSEVALATRAPHPHAAALLVDWFLSKPGQDVVAEKLFRGPRADVAYLEADLMRKNLGSSIVYTQDLVGPVYEANEKRFETLFIRR